MKLLISCLATAAVLCCNGQVNVSQLDTLFGRLNRNNKLMGSFAAVSQGTAVYQNAFGRTDESGTQATASSRYRIGSISKTFTATLVLMEVERGKLTLSTPLSNFYPEIENAQTITIEHLLSHHSGIHNITDDEDYLTYYTAPKSAREMVALIQSRGTDFAPGTRGEYSNSNYILLGLILEKINSKPYESLLQERICKPLGLKNTNFSTSNNLLSKEVRSFNYGTSGWEVEPITHMSIPHGAGAIVSTPTDLCNFFHGLFQGKLIGTSLLEEMKRSRDGFGLGLFVFPFGNRIAYGHNGGIDGFVSNAAYFPDTQLAVALTSNGLNYSLNSAMIGILNLVQDLPYDVPTFKSLTLSTEALKAFEGMYKSEVMPLQIRIFVENGQLNAQAEGQDALPLTAQTENSFVFDAAGIEITFSSSPQGMSMELKQGGMSFPFIRAAP